jgi:hypothetical protein
MRFALPKRITRKISSHTNQRPWHLNSSSPLMLPMLGEAKSQPPALGVWAMVSKMDLGKLASVIHPYPTQADAIRKAADAYRKNLLSDRTRSLLKFLSKLS